MDRLEIPRHVMEAEPITVDELRKKIRNMKGSAKVYLLVDKFSDYAWDDDKERYRYAVPLVYVSKERNYATEPWEEDEQNLILECENP